MDPRSILTALKEASPFDLFLVSFLLLPFVFQAWIEVLEALDVAGGWRWLALGLVLLAYVLGVALLVKGNLSQRRRELARDSILAYLESQGFRMMSYGRIRERINPSYDDAFLESLPGHFPEALRKARLKGNKPGLAHLVEEEAEG
jgi:hypothetical protein